MKAGDIVVFKVVSGEEMIGEVFITFSESIKIKNPAVIMLQQTEKGVGVALMPYMPYCEGDVDFNKSAIVAEGKPSQSMINEYNRIYGAGIQIAPASILSAVK